MSKVFNKLNILDVVSKPDFTTKFDKVQNRCTARLSDVGGGAHLL